MYVMRTRFILPITFGVLIFALFFQWLLMPLAQTGVWMSPDETAVATTAATFSEAKTFLYPVELPAEFFWVHPRSWVYLTEFKRIGPVGFLGLPSLLAGPYALWGVNGLNFFTPLLALATLFILWRVLPKNWPRAAKVSTLLVWMTFPIVVLYANRGLFAQLPVACLAIWMWWGLRDGGRRYGVIAKRIVAGLAGGLALAIRPTELPWLLPLALVGLFWNKETASLVKNNKIWNTVVNAFATIIPSLLVLGIAAWLGKETYGSWLVSGYQIRPEVAVAIAQATSNTTIASPSVSLFSTLPFAFHPRNIWWNVWNYFGSLYWPWLIVSLVSLALMVKEIWKENKRIVSTVNFKKIRWDIVALVWAAAWTILFYGNGVYQDNIRIGEVSVGNSFLRYTLPMAMVLALAAGSLVARAWGKWQFKIISGCAIAILCSIGLWTALARDAEGVNANLAEMARYQSIRNYAKKYFPKDAVILSERSDKVFFPAMLSVSPMPSDEQIDKLLESGHAVGALMTTQNAAGLASWQARGYELAPLETFGNQTLYEIVFYLGDLL